jgi:hypothetical protein
LQSISQSSFTAGIELDRLPPLDFPHTLQMNSGTIS